MYPLVELKEGSIDLFGKALGLKNAIDKMLDYFYEKTKKSKPQAISVISATLKKEQDDIFNKLKEEFPDLYIVKSVFGSVIGAHIGKECLAILWF